ncbi:Cullin-associated NEDD8-dissociated protein 1 [Hordeum vulgare]|nr:Cullin-associated NEDD8-dissociated protein 1 [Hordeum vulgare]
MVDRRSIKNVGLGVRHKVLPQALILIRSSLLQGQALQALQKFFASLVQYANTSFETLSYSLISTAKPSQSGGVSMQALSSIAQFVVVLCLAAVMLGALICNSTKTGSMPKAQGLYLSMVKTGSHRAWFVNFFLCSRMSTVPLEMEEDNLELKLPLSERIA